MNDTIVLDGEFSLIISEPGELDLVVSEPGDFGVIMAIHEPTPIYTGAITIAPVFNNDTILNTANKKVLEDITVLKIPVVYTSNIYDGKTVVIG